MGERRKMEGDEIRTFVAMAAEDRTGTSAQCRCTDEAYVTSVDWRDKLSSRYSVLCFGLSRVLTGASETQD